MQKAYAMRKNTFYDKLKKWLSTSSTMTNDFPTLDGGDVDPIVFGTEYSQPLLKSLYSKTRGQKTLLTLTPICPYQIEKKWPEPPFVNINTYGTVSTEKNNWLGYIPMVEPWDINFEKILGKLGNVNIQSTIKKRSGDYYIQLHLSQKYSTPKDNVIKTYISHDRKQIEMMVKISCDSGKDYIQVSLRKSSKSNNVEFVYNRKVIGTASVKKIAKCLNGKTKFDAFVRIVKFRFEDAGDDMHYSPLYLIIR